MTPDPESVREALADYDKAAEDFRSDKMTCAQFQYLRANLSAMFVEAARAWLAQQDGETSDAT